VKRWESNFSEVGKGVLGEGSEKGDSGSLVLTVNGKEEAYRVSVRRVNKSMPVLGFESLSTKDPKYVRVWVSSINNHKGVNLVFAGEDDRSKVTILRGIDIADVSLEAQVRSYFCRLSPYRKIQEQWRVRDGSEEYIIDTIRMANLDS